MSNETQDALDRRAGLVEAEATWLIDCAKVVQRRYPPEDRPRLCNALEAVLQADANLRHDVQRCEGKPEDWEGDAVESIRRRVYLTAPQ